MANNNLTFGMPLGMAALVVIMLSVVATTSAISSYRDVIFEEWQAFKLANNKTYNDPSEENFRLKTFLDNRVKIAKHNQRAANNLHTYTLSLNKYADLTEKEYKQLNGFKGIKKALLTKKANLYKPDYTLSDEEMPKNLDWRRHGYVTPVKDQGQCGSCWAFSSTGALEGQHYRKTGNLISLSEQNLMDCSTKYGNNGCDGGLMEFAFLYIRDNHGVDTENSYPYEAHDDKCRFKNKTVGADDKGYLEIPTGDEKRLMQVLATKGPVSVAIDASQESFRFYDAGVYDEPQCGNQAENLDHGVLVVGYGHDAVGGDYWLVKNSWGETWGDNGFIKMARNKENQCGIATSAIIPLV